MIGLPVAVTTALARIESVGYEAYAVGGGVRDSLRGLVPDDWDITTPVPPAKIMEIFADAEVRPTGLQHGTVTVIWQGVPLEITTYRSEQGYADGRHPDAVCFIQDIHEDLARRDFTINAMAFSPTRGLCDPYGGADDLAHGILRCVGEPAVRFAEDSLRILRGLRFAAVTGFALAPDTVRGMRATMYRMRDLAPERVRVELCKLLVGEHVGMVLRQYCDILAVVLPELSPMFGMGQHTRHHLYDAWEHTVRAVEFCNFDWRLRMVCLLHDIGKPSCFSIDAQGRGHFYGHPAVSTRMATEVFERLRFSNADSAYMLRLIAMHDDDPATTPIAMRQWIAKEGTDMLTALFHIAQCDTVARGKGLDYLDTLQGCYHLMQAQAKHCLSLRDLAVDGTDLHTLGLTGKQVGDTLQALLDWVLIDPTRNTKSQLLQHTQEV